MFIKLQKIYKNRNDLDFLKIMLVFYKKMKITIKTSRKVGFIGIYNINNKERK